MRRRKRRSHVAELSSERVADHKRLVQPWGTKLIVCRKRHRVNSRRDRAEVAALSHKMRFPATEIARNTLYSLRARAGAAECSVLSSGGPGGIGSAVIFRSLLSRGGGRFAALR